jgi:FkbH-like protein
MLSERHNDDYAVVIAATFTVEPILPAMQFLLEQAELPLNVCLAPYHQVFQELLSSNSLLATNQGGVDVVLVRLEDFARNVENIEDALNCVRLTAIELVSALTQHTQHARVPALLALMPPSPWLAKALRSEIEAANASVAVRARSLPGIILMSAADLQFSSAEERYDTLTDEAAHMPFSEPQYASMALGIARKVHALKGPTFKVLVLDCDDTLWRGVVAEDGADGVTITRGCARLQQFATEIQAQGALVCLVSKNTERDVLEVFEKRSDMMLKLEQVVAYRINWEPKPKNVAELARTLNVGLDAFVFIDDNPIECALMRQELPQVVTLQLPPDDDIESFLSHLWAFEKVAITQEDARRTSMYRENIARHEFEEATTDIAQFIASLALVIDIAAPQDVEWTRAAQLTQRTNQFNFTTVRRSEAELRTLASDGSIVLRVKVRDRFGDYGVVGLIVANKIAGVLEVDTFLLSCRVLGRGVEHAMLRRLGEIAKHYVLDCLDLRYVLTPKNEPARAFAESVAAEHRIEEQGRTVYRLPVDFASAVVHTPGRDPAAVLAALESAESKSRSSVLTVNTNRSELYGRLAQTLVSGMSVHDALRAWNTRARTLSDQPTPPATYMESELLELWEELLGLDSLGVEDDYFALGGTSLIAARLVAELWRRFGVKLPLTVVLEAPTIRALSRHLQHQRNPRAEVLVELSSGGSRNLFLVHDGNGETLLYLNLARRMPDDLAVYGIEPRRLSGVPLAHTTIEEMAGFYIEQVRQRQSHGPYLLGGMCAGGVIAYEMARQLTDAGHHVAVLILLDAARPQTAMKACLMPKPRLKRLRQAFINYQSNEFRFWKRTGSAFHRASQKMMNAALWELRGYYNRWSVQVRFRLLSECLRLGLAWPRFVPELSAYQIYNCAEARYLAKPLTISSIVLVRARAGQGNDTPFRNIYADEMLGWASVAHPLTVIDVDGGHSTMFQERFVGPLSNALQPYLRRKAASVFLHSPQPHRGLVRAL